MKTIEEIENEFRNQIKIPLTKPSKQFFFCPAGFIGSGKTTISKQISEKFNLVRISNDELRLLLNENSYDFSSLKEIILSVSEQFVKDGYSMAFDMNCANPITKEKIDTFSKIPIVWVHINPPEEFIINNIKNRNNPKFFNDVDQVIENYRYQKKALGEYMNKVNYDYKLDPSRDDFPKQMEELYALIESLIS